jgi:hypothetical protein
MSTPILSTHQYSTILPAYNLEETVQYLKAHLCVNCTVFIDVDDTLITPKSNAFRNGYESRLMIDRIKKNKDQYPKEQFEAILSNFRLQRTIKLIDTKWPETIEWLKNEYDVYALTKIDVGSLGNIPSMEEWRYQELKSLGIEFSETRYFTFAPIQGHSPKFHKGIFMTDMLDKGSVIEVLIKTTDLPQIVLIDDSLEQLQDVARVCDDYKIPFLGILFKGISEIQGVPNPEVTHFQEEFLIQKAQWLEDEDAEKRLLKK